MSIRGILQIYGQFYSLLADRVSTKVRESANISNRSAISLYLSAKCLLIPLSRRHLSFQAALKTGVGGYLGQLNLLFTERVDDLVRAKFLTVENIED